ncbi:UvrD-helicase domain-containing protein [Fluviispira multicolorata]|uniref:DNA 3'-5' helicase n=1 Tax=Fluviispira multicolorata TaxID=2654512 RepID=A0A833JF07_9BACT|nr:UvrD-helicase domain-containing protein [Fluviispira multicolorata]KAB8033481.1 AAA family ATPase [Fluviispira multicolorata]
MAELTIEQKQCIEFYPHKKDLQKHLIIEAGAGAGKTQVLTERIYWLLHHKNPNIQISPAKIFVVTFSKDASFEIAERVEKVLRNENLKEDLFPLIHISTIDSFFAELVQCIYPTWWGNHIKNSESKYMPPKLQLIHENIVCQELNITLSNFFKNNTFSEYEKSATIDFILSGGFKKGFKKNKGTLENLLSTMCSDCFLAATENEIRIAAKNIHPATLFLLLKMHNIARLQYEKRLQKGELTYADRTVFLKENLKNNIPIQIQELIVDEYQDTNHIQHAILFHLVQECQARMLVVGDPKQSIYGFRNASVDVFQSIKNDNHWKHIELKKNFRSVPLLLYEINKLSNITFSWQNPFFPNSFKDSYFYKEALHKFIADNPLEVGLKNLPSENKNDVYKSQLQSPSVFIVTASLLPDRFSSDEKKDSYSENKIKLKDYALTKFVTHLKRFKEERSEKWSEYVFLCESNKDALSVTDKLREIGVPVKCNAKNQDDNNDSPELNVALALAKLLAFEGDSFDLYEIMQSSLSPYSHESIEEYFKELKFKNLTENKILNLIEKYRHIAKENFFKAWQLLRWEIVELHEDTQLKFAASVFCAKMDSFAKSLNNKLASPSFQMLLKNKISIILNNLNEAEKLDNFNKFLLPESIDKWDIENTENKIENKEDALEVKTVHGAKGLQWNVVCFLPKFGSSKSFGKFTTSQSSKYLDISWLQDDDDSLSIMQRIQNLNFLENDHESEYKKNGALNKIHWFAKLRNHIEQDFERQRVFYTAFTRAKKNLILFQPMRQKEKGLRDDFHFLKSTDLPFQKYLEEDVYLRYLDQHFFLRSPEKPKGKGSRSLPALIPPEPWYQDGEETPNQFVSKCENIAFYDYGPQFLHSFHKKQKIITKSNPFYEINFTLGPKIAAQTIENKYDFIHNEEQLNSDEIELDHSEEKLNSFKKENIKEILNKLKTQRSKIYKGILYHAAVENRKARKSSIQFLLEKSAYQTFHELEIWSKKENHLHFLNSSRNILDFLALYEIKKFSDFSFENIYDFSTKNSINFTEFIANQEIDIAVVLIVDFKTGKKKPEHLTQVHNYMNIINNFSLKRIDVNSDKKRQYLIMSALCYTKNVDERDETYWEEMNLPKYQFESGESFYLFK